MTPSALRDALRVVAEHRERAAVSRIVETSLPTVHGTFTAVGFRTEDGREHVALVKGDVAGRHDVLVIVCTQCTAGHVLGSGACDCAGHMESALEMLSASRHAILVHLATERDSRIDLRFGGEDVCGPRRAAADSDPVAMAIVADLGPAAVRLAGAAPETWETAEDPFALPLCA